MHLTPEQQAADENTKPEILRILAKQNIELARLVARNSNTDPELLKDLAASEDDLTLAGVTLNPNTPKDILLKLASKFPREFLANSVINLLLIENPNFYVEIPFWALINLLKQDNLPQWLLLGAANRDNSAVLIAVAKHPQTSQDILQQLAIKSKYDDALGLCIVKRKDLGEKVLEKLVEYGTTSVRRYLASQIKTPPNILGKIAEYSELNWNDNIEIQTRIAKHPHTPTHVLEKLIGKGHSKAKRAIALRSNLSKKLIVRLAMDYRVHEMRFLAYNRYLPGDLLTELIQHPELRVRQMVVRHPNVPTNILVKAVEVPQLRLFVAENPHAPVEILFQLTKESRGDVLKAVAENISSPAFVIEELAKNPLYDLLLAQHPNTSPEIMEKVLWRLAMNERLSIRKYVAQHPQTPLRILTQWAKTSPEVRREIAKNVNTPEHILEKLALSSWKKIRRNVARNPNTPAFVLEKLASDRHLEVRQAVARNPNTPEHVLTELVRYSDLRLCIVKNPNTPALVLEKLSEFHRYCTLVLEHPNTTKNVRLKILKILADSFVRKERLRAAQHPETPIDILEKLAVDEEIEVRKFAQRSLKVLHSSKKNHPDHS